MRHKKIEASYLERKRNFTIAEFVESYGVGRTNIYLEIKRGHLKSFKFKRRTLISREAAEAWQHFYVNQGDEVFTDRVSKLRRNRSNTIKRRHRKRTRVKEKYSKENYGEFGEAHRNLLKLKKAIKKQKGEINVNNA